MVLEKKKENLVGHHGVCLELIGLRTFSGRKNIERLRNFQIFNLLQIVTFQPRTT